MGTQLRIIWIIVVLLLMLLFNVEANAADWPRWRGPNGDGISTETDWDPAALAKGPKILWKASLGTSGANVAIKGKYLYTTGGDPRNDTIFCLNAENGKIKWKYSYECKNKSYGAPATPTIDGERVYTLSAEGHVHCLDARNGKVQWLTHIVEELNTVRPLYGFAASPVVEGNLLILNVNSYGIALNKDTGKMVWQSPPVDLKGDSMDNGSEYATPVMYTQNRKRHSVVFGGYGPHSVDVVTGKLNWLYKWNPIDVNIADPIVFDSKVFISQCYGGCVLLDISSGIPKVLWQNNNMESEIVTGVFIDKFIYGCHGLVSLGQGVLRCIDATNGKVIWEKDLGRPMSISAAGTMLLLLTDRGKLHIAEISPDSYKEIVSAQVFELKGTMPAPCWTAPVLCGGKIYCRNTKGDIVCIDVSK